MEAMQRLLSVTIFKLAQRYWWSPWVIVCYFVLLLVISFNTNLLTLAETMFVLYGLGITYIVTLYGIPTGFVASLAAFVLATYPVLNHRMEELRYGKMAEFLLEGLVMPIGFFLLSIYIGRIFLNSRRAAEETQQLYQQVVGFHHKMEQTLAGFILAMSRAIESKDPYTRGHSERVAGYTMLLAEKLELSAIEQKQLLYGAVLHDIGKIGVPDAVLLKEGRLEPDEWVEMQLHPALGRIVLEAVPGLEYVIDPVSLHHENLDGTGYPYGVKEADIPLTARIVAITDSFDAMTSDRPYRKRMSAEHAIAELFKGRGIRYDSKLVELFVEAMKERELRLMTKDEFYEYFRLATGQWGTDSPIAEKV